MFEFLKWVIVVSVSLTLAVLTCGFGLIPVGIYLYCVLHDPKPAGPRPGEADRLERARREAEYRRRRDVTGW